MGVYEEFSAIILAGGCSSRMGCPKQLLEVRGRSMIDHAIAAALDAELPVTVVLGAYKERILESCKLISRCHVAINTEYRDGMATSLRCGVASITPPVRGYIFLLADQPAINSSHILNMIECFRKNKADILYPVYQEMRGNPVIIATHLRDRLLNGTGDQGARFLFRDESLQICKYHTNDAAYVTDIDTQEEYQKITEGCSHRGL